MKLRETPSKQVAGSGWMARLVRCSSLRDRVNSWWFWVSQIIGLGLVFYGNRLLNDSLQITLVTVYFCSMNAYRGGLLTFELFSKPYRNNLWGDSNDSSYDNHDYLTGAEVPFLDDRSKAHGNTIRGAITQEECDGVEIGSDVDHKSQNFSTNVKAHPPLGARASVERGVEVVVIINAGQQGGS